MSIRERLVVFYQDWEYLPGLLSKMLNTSHYGMDSLFAETHLQFVKLKGKNPERLTAAEVDFLNVFSDLDF